MVEQGSTLVLVCRVVGVPSTTVLSYQWTCPGDSCDAGAVDSEWAAKVQQGNILVVNVRNGNDGGNYTCTVVEKDSTTQQVGVDVFTLSVASEYNYYDAGDYTCIVRNSTQAIENASYCGKSTFLQPALLPWFGYVLSMA